jgi:hypothetical protein
MALPLKRDMQEVGTTLLSMVMGSMPRQIHHTIVLFIEEMK